MEKPGCLSVTIHNTQTLHVHYISCLESRSALWLPKDQPHKQEDCGRCCAWIIPISLSLPAKSLVGNVHLALPLGHGAKCSIDRRQKNILEWKLIALGRGLIPAK